MKKLILSAVLVGTLFSASAKVKGENEAYKVNTGVSKVEWIAKKVTGQHNGDIKIKSGSIEISGNNLKGGTFEIDMTTINDLDMEGEWKDKLDGHLRSDDFFSVEKHNVAKFVIKKAEKLAKEENGNNYSINGELTIKGITQEISFPAKVEIKDGKFVAYASVDVDRTKFDIKYGSKNFVEGIGDKAIDDLFNVKLNIAAVK